MKKITKGFIFKLAGVESRIYGGTFLDSDKLEFEGLFKVKMAEEIPSSEKPCDLAIDTRDFQTPDPRALRYGLARIILELSEGRGIYIGCMGGIGRTGFMLAILAKVAGVQDPVTYIREVFNPHACETPEQLLLVDSIDGKYYAELFRKSAKKYKGLTSGVRSGIILK